MLDVFSDDPDAHRLAAAALRKLGRKDEAEQAEQRALYAWEFTPALRQAAAALSQGQSYAAERKLREHLSVVPDDRSAMMMLANIAAMNGFFDDAEVHLRSVLETVPNFVPAIEELSGVLSQQARFTEALAELEKLLQVEPRRRIWLQKKIEILAELSRYNEALELADSILADTPDDKPALLAKGNILSMKGGEESESTYRLIISQDPTFGEAWWSIANLKKNAFSDADVMTMEEQLQNDLSPKRRTHLLFTLGTAKEQSKQYERAFSYYSEGNALWLEQNTYSAGFISQCVDETIGFLDAKRFESFAQGGHQSPEPIFIVGMPRSGSTLTEQILASHASIEGTAELPYIPVIARKIGYLRSQDDKPAVQVLAEMGENRRVELGEDYYSQAQLHREHQLPHFIDKTPNNWLFIPLIRAILPKAKIIDVRRDAMACCFANFKQHFARGQLFTYSLEHVGRYYRDYVRMMDHFDRVAPGYIHHLSYEELVTNPDREIRAMLDYLELEFEEDCLNFHKNQRAVRTASAMQVRRPLDTSTNEAWKPFSPWLGPLRDALGELAVD